MRISKLGGLALTVGIVVVACSEDHLPTVPLLEPPNAAALVMVSGDDQEGKAGEALREPFVVRATDAQGNGVGRVRVNWTVTTGDGVFLDEWSDRTSTITDTNGLAQVSFQPGVLGPSAVTASISVVHGSQRSPVIFTAEATAVVIQNGFWGVWLGPDGSSDVIVPVDTTVEWLNYWPTAHVIATSAPAGGATFDSGVLNQNDRFQFVPDVPGTWEFVDQVNEVTGSLTAQ